MTTTEGAAVAGAGVTVLAAAVGVIRWIVGKERERADALYQTRESCAAGVAAVRADFGEVLVEIRDKVTEVGTKVDLMLEGRVTRGGS